MTIYISSINNVGDNLLMLNLISINHYLPLGFQLLNLSWVISNDFTFNLINLSI